MAKFNVREKVIIPTYNDPDQVMAGEVVFDYEKCTGCTTCSQACPADSILMEEKKPRMKARGQNECIACGACIAICPEGAIRLKSTPVYTGYFKTIDQGKVEPPRL